jgi:hypothetical protein
MNRRFVWHGSTSSKYETFMNLSDVHSGIHVKVLFHIYRLKWNLSLRLLDVTYTGYIIRSISYKLTLDASNRPGFS